MAYAVVLSPTARTHLTAIYDYIAAAASHDVALRFTDALLDHIAGLADFPHRGTMRDDIRPRLRTMSWRRRVTIAFTIESDAVYIMGIFYGGRDFEALLGEE